MECKGRNRLPCILPGQRINRNIMECKAQKAVAQPLPLPVLIETLWNVKIVEAFGAALIGAFVLIETLWNVKSFELYLPMLSRLY